MVSDGLGGHGRKRRKVDIIEGRNRAGNITARLLQPSGATMMNEMRVVGLVGAASGG